MEACSGAPSCPGRRASRPSKLGGHVLALSFACRASPAAPRAGHCSHG
ncbi:hypothetical protein A2U01_0101602 [Trifolium medium]|uniref:Uncharacterized protein n=1 Tax=Trifolium medium TaxID=97028 RepID=A0A392UZS0_9FABA|nr:hypothetical protein [Trifolium medium]